MANDLTVITENPGGSSVALGTYAYDNRGRRTSLTRGNGAVTSYTYDNVDRLVSATGGHNATLTYDPLGRLWQVASATATTRFLQDGDALVAEYDGAGNLLRRHVHNVGADVPLVTYEGATLATPRYLYADQQGSIIALTDTAGQTVALDTYDEYGIPGAANTGRFQYTGQAWLAELGLYYYKARIYSPTLGRFMQTDPVGYGDQFNLYAYVGDDPVNHVDENGMWTKWVHEHMIAVAFPGLTPHQIQVLKNASAYADRSEFQTVANSYRHAMRAPNETPQQARQRTDQLVQNQNIAARRARSE